MNGVASPILGQERGREYASIYSIAYWHYSICKPEKQYSENHKLLTLSNAS